LNLTKSSVLKLHTPDKLKINHKKTKSENHIKGGHIVNIQ